MKILDWFRASLLVCVVLCFWGTAEALPVARLRGTRPVVQVTGGDGAKTWRVAREREPLRVGNIVRAGVSGKADILFNNGTRIKLKQGTQMEIIAIPVEKKPLIVRMIGALGEIFVSAKGPTEIYTAAGTAAVRGTQYLVRLDAQDKTTVTVTEGKVAFGNPQGDVLLGIGETSSATVGSAPTAPRTVDVSGLISWTGEVTGLPLPFEWPFTTPRNEGERLFNQNRFGEASQALDVVVENSNNARDWASLGRAQLFAGDATKAKASYARARQLSPNAEVMGEATLADSLIRISREKPDGDDLQAATETSSLFPAVQALADLQKGDSKAAVRRLNAAGAGATSNFQAKTLLALALVQENDLARAQTAARDAVKIAPRSPGAHAALAMALFFGGNVRDARREAQRAVELDSLSPLALLALGRTELALGQTDDAHDALAQAAVLAPELPIIQVELGFVDISLDRLPQAEKEFRLALGKIPNDARALGGLGTVFARQGRSEEARDLFDTSLKANPDDPNLRAQFADFLVQIGDLKGAREVTEALLARQKRDSPAVGALLIRLSEAALFRQELPDAFGFARRAVQVLPRSALAHYQLGRVYLEQGRSVQAQNQFRLATQLDQELARARYALGLTQELRASGRDSLSPLGQIGAAVESSQAASNIRDLLAPGATERVQASVQNPTVARTATRSYGDVQIDGAIGQKSFSQGSVSVLRPSADGRSLVGLNAEHLDYEGVNSNSGNDSDRAEVIFGSKSKSGPSGVWGLVQTQKSQPGLNLGFTSDSYYEGLDSDRSLSTALVGYNLQPNASQRTRFLLGADHFKQGDSDIFGGEFDRKVRSFHGEVRHDVRGEKHVMSFGLSFGRRSYDLFDLLPAPDPFPSMTTRSNQDYDVSTLYARDVWQPSSNWRITGELKGVNVQQQKDLSVAPAGPPSPATTSKRDRSLLLPNVIVERYFGDRTNVRFRARKLLGAFNDFELLSPTDVFLFSASEDYVPRLQQSARAFDLEIDQTFKDGSFARIGAFRRDLDRSAVFSTGLNYRSSRIDGITLGYEGLLSSQTSYFVNSQWLHGRGSRVDNNANLAQGNEDIGGIPHFQAEVGAQYLSNAGYFMQPSVAYVGDRTVYRAQGLDFASTKADSVFLANLRIGKRWGLRSVLYGEVVNLFNKEYTGGSDFQEVRAPRRQFRIGGSFRF